MSKKLVALFVLAIASFSLVATADTVQIAYSGIGAADTMNVWGGGHNGTNVYSGLLTVNKTGGSNIWSNGTLNVFCIDLPEWASSSTLSYDVAMPENGPVTNPLYGGLMGAEKADYLAELWGRFYDDSWADGSYSAQDRADAESFAAAVWEIVFEALPTNSSGWDVRVDGSAGALGFRAENLDWSKANYWLSQLDGSGPKADLRAFTNAGAQDFLVEVPEPATLIMLGIGSLMLMKKKKHAIA